MKLNNPFDRKKKKNNVPLSLFPASKMTRTSMGIGRATPVYSLDMVQGNRVKISASELTRFASLQVPTMNNFKVSLAAYFVPYVSLDEFFTGAKLRQYMTSEDLSYVLRANEFFDPSFDDSLRVHPAKFSLNIMRGNRLTGSLIDHLGYYVGRDDNFLPSNKLIWSTSGLAPVGVNTELNYDQYFEALNDVGINEYYSASVAFFKGHWGSEIDNNLNRGGSFVDVDGVTSVGALPFDVWAYLKSKDGQQLYGYAPGQIHLGMPIDEFVENWYHTDFYDPSEQDIHNAIWYRNKGTYYHIMEQFYGGAPESWQDQYKGTSWKEFFGNVTPEQIYQSYIEQVCDAYVMEQDGNFQANCIRYLAYMRIYSDWYLNSYYNKLDDFRNMIGYAYLKANLGEFNGTTLNNWFSQENPFVGTDENIFFAPYLQRGECLPVLWEQNYFTSLQCNIDQKMADWHKAGDGVADTPVGTTIREHYFNRRFQAFKDLIARMGFDYRDNNGAVYGSRVKDETLRRSQIVGYREFNVSVSDVQQTSESTKDSTLGQFAGAAVSASDYVGDFDWTADQHGILMILAFVRPEYTAFAGAIDRSILKDDYYDYLLPEFGGVGYQDVLMNEIYPSAANSPKEAFGKAEIYYEYMSVNNECSGTMRTFNKMYHTDRVLDVKPRSLLSPSIGAEGHDKNRVSFLYITEEDGINRIFSDTTLYEPLICSFYFKGTVTRQLPEHIQVDF